MSALKGCEFTFRLFEGFFVCPFCALSGAVFIGGGQLLKGPCGPADAVPFFDQKPLLVGQPGKGRFEPAVFLQQLRLFLIIFPVTGVIKIITIIRAPLIYPRVHIPG